MGKFIDRTGMINYNNKGLKMTIIRCSKLEGQKQTTIDVQFEDGAITYNKNYTAFKQGLIAHPNYKTKSHEEFMRDFYEKNIHAKDIEILEKYEGCKVKIKCRCRVCGHIWYATPDSLLNKRGKGTGCPNCDKTKKKNHDEFINEIKEKFPHIKILSPYINSKTKIECYCEIHNVYFKTTPESLLNKKYVCPQCSIEGRAKSRTKSHEQFTKELKEKNTKVEVLEEYKGVFEKIKCYCKIHNEIFYSTPDYLLQGHGCSKCQFEHLHGETNPRYNPNLTDEEREHRRKIEGYEDFMSYARRYYNYTCQITGQHGGDIVVHHLNGYNWYKEGRTDDTNAITLCKNCHDNFHCQYGKGNNTKEQFEEFLRNEYNKNLRDII